MSILPDSLFALPPVAALLREEMEIARECAARQPRGRALLLAPCVEMDESTWDVSHLSAVRMHVSRSGLDGAVRCTPDLLPWDDAAFQMIVLQHVGDVLPTVAPWVDEVARVLAPGGTLLWFGFNPNSPWIAWCHWQSWQRRRARQTGFSRPHLARAQTTYRQLLARRLQADGLHYAGSLWPRVDQSHTRRQRWRALDMLRAAYFLAARKR
ncbi:MAG: methyltransferase domain-containing protein, partial [Rhodanobacteraceae bacterium]